MKLIADSGSTKTDWVLIGEQQVLFTSSGLNPNILKDEEIVFAHWIGKNWILCASILAFLERRGLLKAGR